MTANRPSSPNERRKMPTNPNPIIPAARRLIEGGHHPAAVSAGAAAATRAVEARAVDAVSETDRVDSQALRERAERDWSDYAKNTGLRSPFWQ